MSLDGNMKKLLLILFTFHFSLLTLPAQDVISLVGSWDFSTADSAVYDDYVMLPECRQVRKAWYKKNVYVPQSWAGRHVTLYLERPYIETTVYVNGIKAGHQLSTSTPHQYNVSPCIKPGGRNTIEVCVYNEQGDRNGIVGKMELRSQPEDLYIKQVKLHPHPFKGYVEVEVSLGGVISYLSDYAMGVMVKREDVDSADVYQRFYDITSSHMTVAMPVGNQVAVWDEFTPHLYRIGIVVGGDYYETSFGMRELVVEGRQLMTNRRPLYLRGTLESCSFPKTGYPPMDEAAWTRILTKIKGYGLNYVRFHSYCPPEAAFTAADKLGVYLQPEGPSEESQLVEDTYGHHPSFFLLQPQQDSVVSILPIIAHGMEAQAEHSLMASGKLQTLCYKYEIERNLMTKDCAGFLLPALDDCSGQDWREFCGPIVPLAKFPKFAYTNADTLVVPVEAYNAMYGDIDVVRSTYYICNDSMKVLAGGQLSARGLPIGKNTPLGTVVFPLDSVKEATKLTLAVQIAGQIKNHWDFWVYPDSASDNHPFLHE